MFCIYNPQIQFSFPYFYSDSEPILRILVFFLIMRLIEGTFQIPQAGLIRLCLRTSDLILGTCSQLSLNLTSCYFALWVFQSNSLIIGFKRMDRFVYGCAAIVLGMKLGECLKRTDDVIMLWRRQVKRATSKENIEDDQDQLKRFKKRVLQAEVNIMTNFAFDLDIKLATQYLKSIEPHLDKDVYVDVERCIRDFYRTQLIVYYEPHMIVLASLQIASRLLNTPLKEISGKPWYKFYSEDTAVEEVDNLSQLVVAFMQNSL